MREDRWAVLTRCLDYREQDTDARLTRGDELGFHLLLTQHRW